MNTFRQALIKPKSILRMSFAYKSGDPGAGAGRGGGGGGSIREAGGAFGKMEAAREEQYFRKKEAEQISHLKEHIHDQISSHKKLIKQHEEEIQKAKETLKILEKESK